MKAKPFAGTAVRRESPASSTGDSSSGRLPLTPRDGSDFSSKGSWDKVDRLSGGLQNVGRDRKERIQKRRVSFDEDVDFDRGKDKGTGHRERGEKIETPLDGENRRRDRRRNEAKAAIEVVILHFCMNIALSDLVCAVG
jgi:serine/arginine repetitive matrix protein 2